MADISFPAPPMPPSPATLLKKIEDLRTQVSDENTRIGQLTSQLAGSVTKDVYTAAETKIGDLNTQIAGFTGTIKGLRQQLADAESTITSDATIISGVTQAEKTLGDAISGLTASVAGLQRTANALGGVPTLLAPAAQAVLSSMAAVAPSIGSRAADIAGRVKSMGSLGSTSADEILAKLDSGRTLSAGLASSVTAALDSTLPQTAMSILSALATRVKGDGATYRQELLPAMKSLTQSLSNACTARGIPIPPSLAFYLGQVEQLVATAPAPAFDVISVLAPLASLTTVEQALAQIAATPSATRSAPRGATAARAESAPDQASFVDTTILIAFFSCKGIEMACNGAAAIFPLSTAYTINGTFGASESAAIGAACGVFGLGRARVGEKVSFGASLTDVGWTSAVAGTIAFVMGIVANTLGAVIAVQRMYARKTPSKDGRPS